MDKLVKEIKKTGSTGGVEGIRARIAELKVAVEALAQVLLDLEDVCECPTLTTGDGREYMCVAHGTPYTCTALQCGFHILDMASARLASAVRGVEAEEAGEEEETGVPEGGGVQESELKWVGIRLRRVVDHIAYAHPPSTLDKELGLGVAGTSSLAWLDSLLPSSPPFVEGF